MPALGHQVMDGGAGVGDDERHVARRRPDGAERDVVRCQSVAVVPMMLNFSLMRPDYLRGVRVHRTLNIDVTTQEVAQWLIRRDTIRPARHRPPN